MKPNSNSFIPAAQFRGFTLVEMLVVITIIAILVSITVPFVARAMTKSKVATARTDMINLKGAIESYHNDYSRFPSARGAPANNAANPLNGGGDLTFHLPLGRTHADGSPHDAGNWANPPITPENSDVMAILMAVDYGANKNHGRNSKKTTYLTPNTADDKFSAGVGPNGVFRDPFGNPYVITVDYDGDNQVSDRFYREILVNKNASIGLVRVYPNTPKEQYILRGSVMIWSPGPDRQVNSKAGALAKENTDNILGWR
jgi:prepilin-type N-terminal cleavage/methylation domain-containing protein